MLKKSQISVPLLIEDLGSKCLSKTSTRKRRYGLYRCECGNEFTAVTERIVSGSTKSCGCYQKKRASESSLKHGMSYTRIHKIWIGINKRISNPKDSAFKMYGGRGIQICSEWKDDFTKFHNWAVENGYDDMLSIDRIDVNGDYEPSNCRWAAKNIQARNTRRIMSTNTSGYRGASWHSKKKKWQSQIAINGKIKYLGTFSTAIEAAMAYDRYIVDNNLEHTTNGVI